mgnify:CR=1 FL=1
MAAEVRRLVQERFVDLLKDRGQGLGLEFRMRTASGEWRWVHCSGRVTQRDADGRALRMTGTMVDIDARKRAEQAVAEGRRFLQQVIDTVPAVINVKDTNLNYLLMNRYMARVLGIEGGRIGPGAVADVCIFDPERYWKVGADTLKSQGKNTPFTGIELKGRVRYTLVEGQVVYEAA